MTQLNKQGKALETLCRLLLKLEIESARKILTMLYLAKHEVVV